MIFISEQKWIQEVHVHQPLQYMIRTEHHKPKTTTHLLYKDFRDSFWFYSTNNIIIPLAHNCTEEFLLYIHGKFYFSHASHLLPPLQYLGIWGTNQQGNYQQPKHWCPNNICSSVKAVLMILDSMSLIITWHDEALLLYTFSYNKHFS
jgi:hypothetical protein